MPHFGSWPSAQMWELQEHLDPPSTTGLQRTCGIYLPETETMWHGSDPSMKKLRLEFSPMHQLPLRPLPHLHQYHCDTPGKIARRSPKSAAVASVPLTFCSNSFASSLGPVLRYLTLHLACIKTHSTFTANMFSASDKKAEADGRVLL